MKYRSDGTQYRSPETILREEMRQLTRGRWKVTYTTNRAQRRTVKARRRLGVPEEVEGDGES